MAIPRPHKNNQLALFCTLHPSSLSAKNTILDLLSSARSYYTTAEAECTTWCYFTPSIRPKAPSQLVPKSLREKIFCGIEIYTCKQALSTQQEKEWFKNFQDTVKNEGLYDSKGEEMAVWYPTAGFVARDDIAPQSGSLVMIAIFTCDEGKRDIVVEILGKYTYYVLEKELDVLTYCILTRPKAPNQILLFERYKDHKTLAAHGSTREFKNMFKAISAHIRVKETKLQEFEELPNAFVSNTVGGVQGSQDALSSKL